MSFTNFQNVLTKTPSSYQNNIKSNAYPPIFGSFQSNNPSTMYYNDINSNNNNSSAFRMNVNDDTNNFNYNNKNNQIKYSQITNLTQKHNDENKKNFRLSNHAISNTNTRFRNTNSVNSNYNDNQNYNGSTTRSGMIYNNSSINPSSSFNSIQYNNNDKNRNNYSSYNSYSQNNNELSKYNYNNKISSLNNNNPNRTYNYNGTPTSRTTKTQLNNNNYNNAQKYRNSTNGVQKKNKITFVEARRYDTKGDLIKLKNKQNRTAKTTNQLKLSLMSQDNSEYNRIKPEHDVSILRFKRFNDNLDEYLKHYNRNILQHSLRLMCDGTIKSTPEFDIKQDLFNIPPMIPISLDYDEISKNYNENKNKEYIDTEMNKEIQCDNTSTLIFYTLNTNYPVCFNVENNDFIIPQILNISLIIVPQDAFYSPGLTPYQVLQRSTILTYNLKQSNINFSFVDSTFIRKNKLSKCYNNAFSKYGNIECFFSSIIHKYCGNITFISLNGFKQDHIILYSYILYYLKSQTPAKILKLKEVISSIKFLDPITLFVDNFEEFYKKNDNSTICTDVIKGNSVEKSDGSISSHNDISLNEYELVNKLFNKYNVDTQIYNLPFSTSNISQLLMILTILHHDKYKSKIKLNAVPYNEFSELCVNHQAVFDTMKSPSF